VQTPNPDTILAEILLIITNYDKMGAMKYYLVNLNLPINLMLAAFGLKLAD